jgi:hypothetical protein
MSLFLPTHSDEENMGSCGRCAMYNSPNGWVFRVFGHLIQ